MSNLHHDEYDCPFCFTSFIFSFSPDSAFLIVLVLPSESGPFPQFAIFFFSDQPEFPVNSCINLFFCLIVRIHWYVTSNVFRSSTVLSAQYLTKYEELYMHKYLEHTVTAASAQTMPSSTSNWLYQGCSTFFLVVVPMMNLSFPNSVITNKGMW